MKNIRNNKSTNVRVNGFVQHLVSGTLNFLWWTFRPLSRLIIYKLFFSPGRYTTSEAEDQMLKKAYAFSVNVNGRRVNFWKWGEGPSILMAHGWNGCGIMLHPFIEPLLSMGYSVIAFDAPGHGTSKEKTSSYFAFTDAVRKILTTDTGDEIVGIIGYSMGGAAVVNAASKEKTNAKIALIAPALMIRELLIATFESHGVNPDIFLSLIRSYEEKYGYSLKGDNPIELLDRVNADIFIVHDRNDKVTPFAGSLSAAKKHKNIELIGTTGLGHKRILYDLETINQILNHISSAEEEVQKSDGRGRIIIKSA